MKRNNEPIKCTYCGRFVSLKALESGAAISKFTPDTHFSSERTDFECPSCAVKHKPKLGTIPEGHVDQEYCECAFCMGFNQEPPKVH